MKRPLFVFAGQSNMMGASVYPVSEQIYFNNSFEYLHKPKRFGENTGKFKNYGFTCGECSSKDLQHAYDENIDIKTKSKITNYTENTYFCPSMCNLKSDNEKLTYSFKEYSEATTGVAASLAPCIVKGLEENGFSCAYTHIAKGSFKIAHYL